MATSPDRILVHEVEAFVGPGCSGNPAGVTLLDASLPIGHMRHVARTMGHSETAFVVPEQGAGLHEGRYGLRWFTPEVEVPLCGHATLAAAHVLFQEGVDIDVLTFETMSGMLHAARAEQEIRLDLPQDHGKEYPMPRALLDALGLGRSYGSTRSPTTGKVLVELQDEQAVRQVRPDAARLLALPAEEAPQGVIVTAPSDGPYDFVSRFFHPWAGILEDPVTGSAHCLLATHWSARLGHDELTGLQCSARGGVVHTRLVENGRVHLEGAARTAGEKQIPLPPLSM